MEFNQQIYRAPSIPKLGRRNVSSSVLSSASKISAASPTPKLKVSRAKFTGRQEPIAEAVVSNAQALAETNLILVEIQKQLSLDFAMRIAEERETIKRMKAAESRRRFGAEEKAVEGTGKLGKGIGKVFNKVISPAKSIFGRIIDFFSIILTGIVFNNAFRWLQDKNNREKVLGVINWVTKHWKELLGVFIGVKVFGFLYKLIGLGKTIAGFFGGRGGRGRGPGGRGPGGRGPGGLDPCGGISKCIGKLKGAELETLAEKLVKTKAFSDPKKSPVASALGGLGTALGVLGTIIDVVSLLLIFAPIPGSRLVAGALRALRLGKFAGIFTKFGRFAAGTKIPRIKIPTPKPPRLPKAPSAPKPPKFGRKGTPQPIQPQINPKSKTRREYVPQTQEEMDELMRSSGLPGFSSKPNVPVNKLSKERLYGQMPSESDIKFAQQRTPAQASQGKLTEETANIILESIRRQSVGRQSIGRSKGGTIFGSGSPNVDSVPAMLAPGEEVIRASEAKRFRGILKAINDGEAWQLLSGAIKKLFIATRRQEETTRKFGEVTGRLDKSLQKQKQKAAIKSLTNSGGGSRPNYNLGPTSGGGMTFLPMVLPTKQSAPPTIPTPQAPATEVPFISSMNVADPYRQLTPEIYGIFV